MHLNNVITFPFHRNDIEERLQRFNEYLMTLEVTPSLELEIRAFLAITEGNKQEAVRITDILKRRNASKIRLVK